MKTEKTNGEAPANSSDEVKASGPPKAMVKPQVLTHVIEGYVIQEGKDIMNGPGHMLTFMVMVLILYKCFSDF